MPTIVVNEPNKHTYTLRTQYVASGAGAAAGVVGVAGVLVWLVIRTGKMALHGASIRQFSELRRCSQGSRCVHQWCLLRRRDRWRRHSALVEARMASSPTMSAPNQTNSSKRTRADLGEDQPDVSPSTWSV